MSALESDGGSDLGEDAVERVREALRAAREAAPDERDEHLKAALGGLINLRAEGVPVADLQDQLTSALVAPDEEAPYFLNRAEELLPDPEEQVDVEPEEPPEAVRWLDEEHTRGVVELELSRDLIEWIELEVDEHGFDGVADWIDTRILVQLGRELRESHGFRHETEIEVPEDFARRARLYYNDLKARGSDPSLRDIIYNHINLDAAFTLHGRPLEDYRDEDDDRPFLPEEDDGK